MTIMFLVLRQKGPYHDTEFFRSAVKILDRERRSLAFERGTETAAAVVRRPGLCQGTD